MSSSRIVRENDDEDEDDDDDDDDDDGDDDPSRRSQNSMACRPWHIASSPWRSGTE